MGEDVFFANTGRGRRPQAKVEELKPGDAQNTNPSGRVWGAHAYGLVCKETTVEPNGFQGAV